MKVVGINQCCKKIYKKIILFSIFCYYCCINLFAKLYFGNFLLQSTILNTNSTRNAPFLRIIVPWVIPDIFPQKSIWPMKMSISKQIPPGLSYQVVKLFSCVDYIISLKTSSYVSWKIDYYTFQAIYQNSIRRNKNVRSKWKENWGTEKIVTRSEKLTRLNVTYSNGVRPII